jgi:iron complex transport system permease protein
VKVSNVVNENNEAFNKAFMENKNKSRLIKKRYKKFTGRKICFILTAIFALFLISGISATLGSYPLTVREVYSIIWRGVFATPDITHEIVVWNLRLPRILMGIIAGIGLAVAGAAMQGILKNPLASPFTIGISAGAGFGAALAILLGAGITTGKYLIIGNAFLFSLVPTFIILVLTKYRKATPETMILGGIAIMYVFSAMTTLLMFFSDSDAVREAYFWTVGSLGRAKWEYVFPSFIIVTVCLVPLIWKSLDLNVMGSGDESAKSLGVNVEGTRVLVMVLASLMTAAVISFTGTIGFIGLVAPHICRMVVGGDNKFLFPVSGLLGAIILLFADTLARTIMAPVVLPVGVVTAFLGGPLFLYLITKRRKEFW